MFDLLYKNCKFAIELKGAGASQTREQDSVWLHSLHVIFLATRVSPCSSSLPCTLITLKCFKVAHQLKRYCFAELQLHLEHFAPLNICPFKAFQKHLKCFFCYFCFTPIGTGSSIQVMQQWWLELDEDRRKNKYLSTTILVLEFNILTIILAMFCF